MTPAGVRAVRAASCKHRISLYRGRAADGANDRHNMEDRFAKSLEKIVGARYALTSPEELRSYMYDGGVDRGLPSAAVLPGSTEEVAAIVRLCVETGTCFVPRGAGTGLSGGAVAENGA